MTHKLLFAPLLALGLALAPAHARPQPASAPGEASIAFANSGGIRDWRAEGDRTIYIRDRANHWYKATLLTPALDLSVATAIGFDTGPVDSFDRTSWVVVRGQRYAVDSLVRIDGPPPRRQHKHR
jgi:hypothetical protein